MRISSLALMLALAGCAVAEPPRLALLDRGPRQSQALYGGAVVARSPAGYCVDAAASRPRQGLAVMVGCRHLGGTAPTPPSDAVIAVQVGAAGSASVAGNETALARILEDAEGLILLGGQADRRLAVETAPGLVIVRIDGAPPGADGADGAVDSAGWRAFVDVAGRLTSVTVAGRTEAPLVGAAGLRVLEAAVVALQAANGPRRSRGWPAADPSRAAGGLNRLTRERSVQD